MDIVNEYLQETRKSMEGLPRGLREMLDIRPKIICADGFTVSVQASLTHYCSPRDNYGPYSEVELGFPSQEEPDIMDWAEDPDAPTGTVYGYVPVTVVAAVIDKHGGIDRNATLRGGAKGGT